MFFRDFTEFSLLRKMPHWKTLRVVEREPLSHCRDLLRGVLIQERQDPSTERLLFDMFECVYQLRCARSAEDTTTLQELMCLAFMSISHPVDPRMPELIHQRSELASFSSFFADQPDVSDPWVA